MLVAIYIIAFVVAVFILVLVHECGHFLAARCCNVKVERFSLGFGKPLYKWRRNESGTEYVIAPILLGGYVKFLDTRETKQQCANAFDRKPILQRLVIIMAGPIANVLLAMVMFWVINIHGFVLPKPIIGKIMSNSIASLTAMQPGQEIIAIDQRKTSSWEDVIVGLFARLGDNTNLHITTRSLTQTHTYNLKLKNWHSDTYAPNPLLDFGIVPYTPKVLPIINDVVKNSPAEKFGLLKNDRIIAVAGKRINNWEDFIKLVQQYPEQKLQLQLIRAGKAINLTVLTDWKFGVGLQKIGFLGVGSLPIVWPKSMLREYKYAPWPALKVAWQKILLYVDLNYIVFSKLITGKISFNILGGPISIFTASGQALGQGLIMFLKFLAIISLSLALINLLPLPGLDGGYIILLLIEAIMRKPLSMRLQLLILRLGIIFFVVLILQVTLNDLQRMF